MVLYNALSQSVLYTVIDLMFLFYSVLNSVECYNTQNDAWFYVKQMSEPRLGASTCFYDGKLFVVGGYGDIISKASGSLVLDTVESFNPRTNRYGAFSFSPRCVNDLCSDSVT